MNWILSFLSNRYQRVVLGDGMSTWVPVHSGVPQGSVLGPILFAAYVNDLPHVLSNICKLYADYCKIMARVNSVTDVRSLQLDLDAVSN